MRSTTAGEDTILAAQDQDVYSRLKVANGSGTLVDLSDLPNDIGALVLDGTDDYVTLGAVASYENITKATFAAAFKIDVGVVDHSLTTAWSDTANNSRTLRLYVEAAGRVRFDMATDQIGGNFVSIGTTTLTRDGTQRYAVFVSVDLTQSTDATRVRIWLATVGADGIVGPWVAETLGFSGTAPSATNIPTVRPDFRIGITANGTFDLDGTIYDIRHVPAVAIDSPNGYQLHDASRFAGGAWYPFYVDATDELGAVDGTLVNQAAVAADGWTGRDFVRQVRYQESVDQPIRSLIVTLHREEGSRFSLAPLMSTSVLNKLDDNTTYGPLLSAGRAVVWEVATTAQGVAPVGGDWQEMFRGEIDRVEWPEGKPTARIVCRDEGGGNLQDRWIEAERPGGDDDDLEVVIQDILDTESTGVTLWTPSASSAAVRDYSQKQEPVLAAIRTLAQAIGWDCRYMWDDGTSAFRLKLFAPDRTKTTPDATFAANRILAIRQLNIDRVNVRNVCTVFYVDSAGNVASVTDSRAASITAFGRRYIQIAEEKDSAVDDATKAAALRDAVLDDLEDPLATQSIESTFFWPAELGDLYRFSANGIHYDSDQDLASVAITHLIDARGARTLFTVRGKPAGAYLQWLRRGQIRDLEAPEVTIASDGTFDPIKGSGHGIFQAKLRLNFNDRTKSVNIDWSVGTTGGTAVIPGNGNYDFDISVGGVHTIRKSDGTTIQEYDLFVFAMVATITPYSELGGAAGTGVKGESVRATWPSLFLKEHGNTGGRFTNDTLDNEGPETRIGEGVVLKTAGDGLPLIEAKARWTRAAGDPGWSAEDDDGRVWWEPI